MKTKIYITALLAIAGISCSNESDQFTEFSSSSINENEVMFSRSLDAEATDSLVDLVPYLPTEMELNLMEFLENRNQSKIMIRSAGANTDRFLSSNLDAISGLPFSLKVHSIASNSTAGANYLYATGKKKEVYLSTRKNDKGNLFYLEYAPFSFFYGPLIMSSLTNTQLCVGMNTKNPDRKYLMVQGDDMPLNTSWQITPSQHTGYFYFECKSSIGQTDPNDALTSYYNVIEAISKNEIGFAKQSSNKPQQEFMITLNDSFYFDRIEYDTDNAVIKDGPFFVADKITEVNAFDYPVNTTQKITATTSETSLFDEIPSSLKFNMLNAASTKIPRPIVIARRAVIDKAPKDVTYIPAITKKYSKTVSFECNIAIKARTSMELTCKFYTYRVEMPYVVVSKLNDRELKIAGTWKGYILADPAQISPVVEPHFYDIETGAEIN